MRFILWPLMACLLLTLGACESLQFYSQAAAGQLSLMSNRESIKALIEDPDTSASLREKLELVLELRRFAQDELQLPVEGQYSHYVDLERDAVVWNVFVAPELSLEAKSWCYPIAGCAAYRGYFHEDSAREYAAEFAAQGFDTYVGGVAAYSTLGWLDDPVLSTFIHRQEAQLADLVFHELAHQVLYLPGDTRFNESFATAVAQEGVRRWMESRGDTEAFSHYIQERRRQDDFTQLVSRHRAALVKVYESELGESEKRALKSTRFEALRTDYASLQHEWGGSHDYSAWMAAPMSNAKLNSVALYYDLVPAFLNLLAEEENTLSEFYSRCQQFEGLDPAERYRQLKSVPVTKG
ncbi:MAG: aminopeptidase [Halioglobus sp.]